MPKAGGKRGVQGRALSLGDSMLPTTVGSSYASDCWAVPRVRLQGAYLASDCRGCTLRLIAGAVPCVRLQGRASCPIAEAMCRP